MTDVLKKDITFTPIGSTGPGGQAVNKNSTGVRAVHNPTGITVVIRTRSLQSSKRKATEEIRRRVRLERQSVAAAGRKDRWRHAIAERKIIRSYNFTRNEVRDHRTGQRADLKKVLGGDLESLRTLVYFEQLRLAKMQAEVCQ